MANRDNSDPSGLGNTLGWAFAWPANRRIVYNRASADPSGKPWNPKRQLVNGMVKTGTILTWQTSALHHRIVT
ncbi:formate dehydrogenase subunit alpha [Actinobacillus equuli]|nr:formate dehydrogenase subunit alpha [Actinobacillus equuli]